jgi:hypothetical protein
MSARVVTSVLRTGDRVRNTSRRFGSAPEYLQCALEQHGQPPVPMLLTVDECRDGVERAKANPEDCLPFESEEVRFERFRETVKAECDALIEANRQQAIQACAQAVIEFRRLVVTGVLLVVALGVAVLWWLL